MNTTNIIEVVPYDSVWPNQFRIEAEYLKKALGDNCICIHHIGSTSIPDLAAKPVIDMLPVVRNILHVDQAVPIMQTIGYEAKGEYGIPFRRYFQKGQEVRTHNVHVFEEGNPEVERHLKFRDWMRVNQSDRDAYASLKQELAQKHSNDMMAYCLGKEAFIDNIHTQIGFCGLRIAKALTPREWEKVRHYRQHEFFDKVAITDPYTWTFNHQEHIHFVLYQGTQIIGYSHIQFWLNHRCAMRIILIEESYRNQGLGGQFLLQCERWLSQQGMRGLHIESSPEALNFYIKSGYVETPFNDPEHNVSHPNDIALGKSLGIIE